MTDLENPADPEDFFDKLSDDDDRMDGVEEAEEAPEKKKKTVKAKATISNRVVLNERLLCGPKGLVKYMSFFKVFPPRSF